MAKNNPRSFGIGVLLAIFDFPVLNLGFRAVIDAEPGMRVVGEIDDRASLRERIAGSGADVVITECEPFAVGTCSTVETLETIRSADPRLRIIALECRCGAEQFSRALKSGAEEINAKSITEFGTKEMKLRMNLSRRQREILIEGGLLPYTVKKRK
mgnify:CR=1 FL=1